MNAVVRRPAERLPRGIWSSAVMGMSAASAGWMLTGLLPTLTTSYARLDQLTTSTETKQPTWYRAELEPVPSRS